MLRKCRHQGGTCIFFLTLIPPLSTLHSGGKITSCEDIPTLTLIQGSNWPLLFPEQEHWLEVHCY